MRLASTKASASSAAESVSFDFHSPDTFERALAGVERVFLLRPPALARARADFGPFIDAMAGAGIAQVVFLSVRGAASNPLLPHAGIEKLLDRSGLSCVHLRPNDFMQNFATAHRDDIRDRSAIWSPGGRGRTSYVDSDDVAAVAAQVLLSPDLSRRAYTLTGGAALNLDEVASVLARVLGRTILNRHPTPLAFLRHSQTIHRPLAVSLVMLAIGAVAELELASAISRDVQAVLGRPPTSFEVFARAWASSWMKPPL